MPSKGRAGGLGETMTGEYYKVYVACQGVSPQGMAGHS